MYNKMCVDLSDWFSWFQNQGLVTRGAGSEALVLVHLFPFGLRN